MDASLVITISAIVAGFFLILLCIVVFFLYKYFKLKELEIKNLNEQNRANKSYLEDRIPKKIIDEIQSEVGLLEQSEAPENLVGHSCIDHPELQAVGRCAISADLFCELCLTKENDIKLSRKYLGLWLDNEWETIFFVNNEKVGADILNELMKQKKEIWHSEKIPIVTQKQFKINIEEDKSESYTIVMAKTEDKERISKEFNYLNP